MLALEYHAALIGGQCECTGPWIVHTLAANAPHGSFGVKRLLPCLLADACVLHSPALQALTLVGWYHSHPSSQCDPSLTDITNQVAQQAAHRTAEGCEPYIAAIVGPFSRQTCQARTNVAWFSVERVGARPVQAGDHDAVTGCVPMQLEVSWCSLSQNRIWWQLHIDLACMDELRSALTQWNAAGDCLRR